MNTNGNLDLSPLAPLLERYQDRGRTYLLPLLHEAQAIYGYLPEPVLIAIGHALHVPPADIHGVVEFYTMFYDEPVGKRMVRICTDPACAIAGGEEVLVAACHHAGGIHPGEMSADGSSTVERATCLGLCDQAPGALVDDTAFRSVLIEDVPTLFDARALPSALRVTGEPRVMTRNINMIAATDLAAHREAGTFAALEKALTILTPEQVIDEVKASGLVGRGGAAFPTGNKWQFTRAAQFEPKYVVCNADESEPGTFKDRVLMEGDPFRVLEGIMLCGYAIGAEKGYLFIRGEYPQATRILQAAIDAMLRARYLGESILGSDFSFDIEIRRGAGAYICGEETALFEAIEGKRGFPRLKPPFPTTHGLFLKPTAINNVETLAAVPDIIVQGGAWFRQWGTQDSAGMKLFCVSGHVKNPGVVEVPFGVTVRALIEQHCGGFIGTPQAILMGGAAGGFLTPEQFDTPLTFEDLRKLGAPVGSGVLMVFNETVDLRDVLRGLAHFFAHESCGKCYPCQLGTQRQMEILDRVVMHSTQQGDFIALLDIGATMTEASICGLGQTASAAVMSALNLWPELIEEPAADNV
jgi:NADH-quinone oxidoreductase subunit F